MYNNLPPPSPLFAVEMIVFRENGLGGISISNVSRLLIFLSSDKLLWVEILCLEVVVGTTEAVESSIFEFHPGDRKFI